MAQKSVTETAMVTISKKDAKSIRNKPLVFH